MSESAAHMDLVRKIYEYVGTVIPAHSAALVRIDSPETQRTTNVNGFWPDVYFQDRDVLIIGEAKTEADLLRKHSQEQYAAYVEYCRAFAGQATLVIGVPWQSAYSARNYFARINRKGKKIGIAVVTDAGQVWPS